MGQIITSNVYAFKVSQCGKTSGHPRGLDSVHPDHLPSSSAAR